MYKVFLKNKCIFFQEVLNNTTFSYPAIPFESDSQLKTEIEIFSRNETQNNLIFFHQDKEFLFSTFLNLFPVIEAAGGIVKNKSDEILFIFRRGKWDLPKGKRDEGETITECALREVQEECGLQTIRMNREIIPTYHLYYLKQNLVLKKTVWFEMFLIGDETPLPQAEEDITDIKWFNKNNLNVIYLNTFPLITDLLDHYQNKFIR